MPKLASLALAERFVLLTWLGNVVGAEHPCRLQQEALGDPQLLTPLSIVIFVLAPIGLDSNPLRCSHPSNFCSLAQGKEQTRDISEQFTYKCYRGVHTVRPLPGSVRQGGAGRRTMQQPSGWEHMQHGLSPAHQEPQH